MKTVYDWLTLGIFGGLIVLFLDRSSKPEPSDHLWQYLVPAVGCGLANYAGNNGEQVVAVAIVVAVVGYILAVLKPFGKLPGR